MELFGRTRVAKVNGVNSSVGNNINNWFYIFIILHLCLWTIIPAVIRYTLPMDSLEGFVWGQTLQLGYDRNPWLNAWLTSFAVEVGGRSGWLVYFLSQLAVVTCFVALWKLGKKFFHPIYALAAVLILEGVQYYNLAAVDFNDNVLEIALWAPLALYFYQAVKEQKVRDWLLVGVFSALALMAKYFAVMLFAPMLMVLLVTSEGRTSFARRGIYCGVAMFVLLIAPHFWWVFMHDLSTLNYAFRRVHDVGAGWHNSPLYFLSVQLLAFVPSLLLFSLLGLGSNQDDDKVLCCGSGQKLTGYDRSFLLWMAFGPLFFTVSCAFLFGFTLHTMWGTPLLSLWGLALVSFWQPKITTKKLHRFIGAVFILFFTLIFAYSGSLMFRGHQSSANYPGQEIANYVVGQVEKQREAKPYYVVGDRYVAGNVAFFAKSKLLVCIIDDYINTCPKGQELREKGAIFVWRNDVPPNENLFKQIKGFYKLSSKAGVVFFLSKDFPWKRNPDKSPVNIGAALLPALGVSS